MSHVLSPNQVTEMLEQIGEGRKVIIKFFHERDRDTIRVIRGPLFLKDSRWLLRLSATGYRVIQNPSIKIVSISEIDYTPSRSASQFRAEEGDAMDAAVGFETEEDRTPSQPQPAQDVRRALPPPPEPSAAELLQLIREQQRQTHEEMAQLKTMILRQHEPAPQVRSAAPASDIAALYQMGDAIRGKDNPTIRLANGLIIPRYLQQRFMIFSMPHLVYQFDSATNDFIKVPRGTAVPAYTTMLAQAKLQFPAQIPTATLSHKRGRDDKSTPTDNMESVRIQIEIAERVFIALLAILDNQDAARMPTTRDEWMLFIDAGAQLLALYATLAFGFIRGGSKVTLNYNEYLHNGGTFNPAKLWSSVSEFRKQ